MFGQNDTSKSTKLMWWSTLLVAVLAVPPVGFIAAKSLPFQGLGEVVVFVITCWVCTWLGMMLMRHPSMQRKLGGKE